jgi:hypothetical protein
MSPPHSSSLSMLKSRMIVTFKSRPRRSGGCVSNCGPVQRPGFARPKLPSVLLPPFASWLSQAIRLAAMGSIMANGRTTGASRQRRPCKRSPRQPIALRPPSAYGLAFFAAPA